MKMALDLKMKQLTCLIVAVTFANSVCSAENEKIIKIDWNLTVTKFDFPDSSELDSPGIEISSLLEHWTSDQEVGNGKSSRLGLPTEYMDGETTDCLKPYCAHMANIIF